MDIYNKLPEEIQWYVHKMHMTHHIFKELIQVTSSREQLCLNCAYHGFPCLNCACYKFKGKLGPGFSENERTMIPSYQYEDEESHFNMVLFNLMKKLDMSHI